MQQRHLVTAATLAGLSVVLVLMALWGINKATQPLPSLSSGEDKCTAAEVDVQQFVRRRDITVSVYNAGGRKGLASETLDMLEVNNFKPGEFSNAPAGVKVVRAEVHTTKENDKAALLVANNLGANTPVVVDPEDYGPGLAVFVGNNLRRLNPKPLSRVKLDAPVQTCVPVN